MAEIEAELIPLTNLLEAAQRSANRCSFSACCLFSLRSILQARLCLP